MFYKGKDIIIPLSMMLAAVATESPKIVNNHPILIVIIVFLNAPS